MVTTNNSGNVCCSLSDEDMTETKRFHLRLLKLINTFTGRSITYDLSCLHRITFIQIAILIHLYKKARKKHIALLLKNPSTPILEVLKLAKIHTLFTIQ